MKGIKKPFFGYIGSAPDLRFSLPFTAHRHQPGNLSKAGQWQFDYCRRQDGRLCTRRTRFYSARFMKCRPSAVNYNTYTQEDKVNGDYTGIGSGSKNYAPTNPELSKRVQEDIAEFLKENPSIKKEDIPTDLLTASGSGLDPQISPKSAEVQIPALAKATGLSEDRLKEIVKENSQGKWLGIFGEDTVNVLKVNLQIAKDLNLVKDAD